MAPSIRRRWADHPAVTQWVESDSFREQLKKLAAVHHEAGWRPDGSLRVVRKLVPIALEPDAPGPLRFRPGLDIVLFRALQRLGGECIIKGGRDAIPEADTEAWACCPDPGLLEAIRRHGQVLVHHDPKPMKVGK